MKIGQKLIIFTNGQFCDVSDFFAPDFIGLVQSKIMEQMIHHWKARTSIFLIKQHKRAWHHGICHLPELKKV